MLRILREGNKRDADMEGETKKGLENVKPPAKNVKIEFENLVLKEKFEKLSKALSLTVDEVLGFAQRRPPPSVFLKGLAQTLANYVSTNFHTDLFGLNPRVCEKSSYNGENEFLNELREVILESLSETMERFYYESYKNEPTSAAAEIVCNEIREKILTILQNIEDN